MKTSTLLILLAGSFAFAICGDSGSLSKQANKAGASQDVQDITQTTNQDDAAPKADIVIATHNSGGYVAKAVKK